MRRICHQRKKQEESSGLDMANRNHAVQEKQDVGRARIIPGCSDLCATAKFLSPGSRYQNVWPGPPRTWAIPTSQFSGDTGRTRNRYMYEFLYKIVPCQ